MLGELAATHTVIGHDRGGRVAHRWGLDRPDQVERLAVLDIVPTREMWKRLDTETGTADWHWLFHLGYCFERWTYQRQGLSRESVAEHVRAFSAPGALRAGFDTRTLGRERTAGQAATPRNLGKVRENR